MGRLVREVADKCQLCTQRSWQRPYGVGLLVAGVDALGPHLYQTCPSGQFWKYRAMAIGARSQAARTYLERKVDEFDACDADGLIQHALAALQVRRKHLSGCEAGCGCAHFCAHFTLCACAGVAAGRRRDEQECGGQRGV